MTKDSRTLFSVYVCTLLSLAFGLTTAEAQPTTTVQLPTVRTFGMSTTISVPDQGSVYAGGISSSSLSSSRRGSPFSPFTSRSFGRASSTSDVGVSAFVHDLNQMDKAVLRQAGVDRDRLKAASSNAVTRRSASSQHMAVHRQPRVSDIRRRVEADRAEKYAEASRRIRWAVTLERQGKLNSARRVYRSAYATSKPVWQQQIRTRIALLDASLIAPSQASDQAIDFVAR